MSKEFQEQLDAAIEDMKAGRVHQISSIEELKKIVDD